MICFKSRRRFHSKWDTDSDVTSHLLMGAMAERVNQNAMRMAPESREKNGRWNAL